jgi:mono/diheme cytochrome c family protein
MKSRIIGFIGKNKWGVGILVCTAFSVFSAHADDALIKKGEVVFNTVAGIGCKGCHGDYAEGDLGVGPFIRGATEGSVRAAIGGIGEMIIIKNVIKEDEILAVSAYINYLGSTQVARTLTKRGRFLPETFSTRPGTNLQLVIKNGSFKPHTYQSDNLGVDPFTISARGTGSFLWKAPGEEGSFTLNCTNCKLEEQYFTIQVDKAARKFHSTAPATKTTGTM